jgi:hypothetical protein
MGGVKNTNRFGLRLIAIIFMVSFIANLPQNGFLPDIYSLYRALIASCLAALMLLERK